MPEWAITIAPTARSPTARRGTHSERRRGADARNYIVVATSFCRRAGQGQVKPVVRRAAISENGRYFRTCLNAASTAIQVICDGDGGQASKSRVPCLRSGEVAMAFKVGDAVRLKAGGAQMTVSKLFKSPERREMVQCTWFDKKSRAHRAEFVMDSLEAADAIMLRLMQRERV